jgi:hypothetical protein
LHLTRRRGQRDNQIPGCDQYSWSVELRLAQSPGTGRQPVDESASANRPLHGWEQQVNAISEFTVPEKILLAAEELEQQGQSPFSAETLIVAAWQKYPKTFGLKGFTDQYPDSNKVLASIMGEKGLTRKGWLVKMGQKMYAVTREGRQIVRKLHQGEDTTTVEAVKLTRDQEKFLNQLFNSSAMQKYEEGRKLELNFADACRYWGISENMNSATVNAKLVQFRAGLAELDKAIGLGESTLTSGRAVSAADIGLLSDVHSYLEERFGRHLSLLRSRSGRG